MDYKPSKAFQEYKKNGTISYDKKPSGFRITFNAPVVLIYVALCFIATILGIVSQGALTTLLFRTYHSSLADPLTYVRFFTSCIGHSGWEHFIGNATFLLLLGPMLEERYGSRTLVEIIVLTAFVTSVFHYIFFPNVALCGASGVVFAFILLSSFAGFREGEIPLTFIIMALIYFGGQIYDGLFVQDNVSNLGHIIGGLVGATAGFLLNKKSE